MELINADVQDAVIIAFAFDVCVKHVEGFETLAHYATANKRAAIKLPAFDAPRFG